MTGSAYVLRIALIAGVATVTLGACSGPVAVQAPQVNRECENLLSAAPIRLLGELQRETDPRDVAAIAWGSPPIVFVCGVEHTATPDAQVVTVDGLDWIAEVSENGTVFTTLDSQPVLQLRVPAKYRPEIEAVVEITSILPVR